MGIGVNRRIVMATGGFVAVEGQNEIGITNGGGGVRVHRLVEEWW